LVDRALTIKERAEKTEQASKKRKIKPIIPRDNNGIKLILNIFLGAIPGLEGESQGGITITLALGSPRRPSFPFGDLPASTAPARQTIRVGRPLIKIAKAQKVREDKYLLESQPK